jgi:hypothetical protein
MFYEGCVNGREVVLGQARLYDAGGAPACSIEAPHLRSYTFEVLSEIFTVKSRLALFSRMLSDL